VASASTTEQIETALVTGGTGFVGSRLAAFLAARGVRVRAVVRRSGDHPNLGGSGIEQVVGDFTDAATARAACAGMDVVVHCAASLADDLGEIRRVNVAGTAGLVAAARAAGCRRFVHISTVSVYDWESGLAVYDETAPLKSTVKLYPHTPAASPYYGLSKAEGELALRTEMAGPERGLAATILRLGAVLGVHPTSSWAVEVPAKVRRGLVPLKGDGGDVLPWTHIDNVCHAVGLALAEPASVGRVYNVVDGHVTWHDYVEEVRGWFPDAPPAPVIPRGPGEGVFVGRCAGDRIVAELGYAPLRTYAEGMAEAAAWWHSARQVGTIPTP
jgi:nucleoside-diphosphate-sugar epimerase